MTENGNTESKSGAKNGTRKKVNVRKIVSRTITVLFLGGIAALLVIAAMPKPVPVDVAEVARGPLEVTIDEDGVTRVKDRYVVSLPLSGSLGRLELRAGDAVTEGGVLARVEHHYYDAGHMMYTREADMMKLKRDLAAWLAA